MSIASGRAWLQAGQGLNAIGEMALQREELDRAHRRQDAADAAAAMERAQAAAEFADRTGIAYRPATAPAVTFTPPTFGESLPGGAGPARPGFAGIAAPATGWMGAPTSTQTGAAVTQPTPWAIGAEASPATASDVTARLNAQPSVSVAPVAPSPAGRAPLDGIGTMALAPRTPPTVMRGLDDTFQSGGFVKAGPSAADRTAIQAAQLAGRVGDARARLESGVAGMSGTDRTLVGAGQIPEVVINRATQQADERQAADEFRRAYPYDPKTRRGILPNLSDAETVRQGRDISNELNKMRAGGAPGGGGTGGGTGGGVGATRQALQAVEKQVDDSRTDLGREEARQYRGRDVALKGTPAAALPAATRQFVTDSTAAADRLTGLRTRTDSLGTVRDRLAARLPGMPTAPAIAAPAGGAPAWAGGLGGGLAGVGLPAAAPRGSGATMPADTTGLGAMQRHARELKRTNPGWTNTQIAAQMRTDGFSQVVP